MPLVYVKFDIVEKFSCDCNNQDYMNSECNNCKLRRKLLKAERSRPIK